MQREYQPITPEGLDLEGNENVLGHYPISRYHPEIIGAFHKCNMRARVRRLAPPAPAVPVVIDEVAQVVDEQAIPPNPPMPGAEDEVPEVFADALEAPVLPDFVIRFCSRMY